MLTLFANSPPAPPRRRRRPPRPSAPGPRARTPAGSPTGRRARGEQRPGARAPRPAAAWPSGYRSARRRLRPARIRADAPDDASMSSGGWWVVNWPVSSAARRGSLDRRFGFGGVVGWRVFGGEAPSHGHRSAGGEALRKADHPSRTPGLGQGCRASRPKHTYWLGTHPRPPANRHDLDTMGHPTADYGPFPSRSWP